MPCYGFNAQDSVWSRGRDFSLCCHVQTGSGIHTASFQWLLVALSLAVKLTDIEDGHLPSSSAVVKNAWCYAFASDLSL